MGKDEREFFPFWLKFHLHLRKSEEHFTGRQSQDEKEDIENENNTIRRPADADNTCRCVIDRPKQVETDLGCENGKRSLVGNKPQLFCFSEEVCLICVL